MAPFVIHANLDCEARWAGVALPASVATRISHYGALLSVLAPPDADVEVWTPADTGSGMRSMRCERVAWRAPRMRVGVPPHADLAWANPDARAANDRRLAHAVEVERGWALPGAKVIARVDEIDVDGAWVVKAPWTAAGRDRCHGSGAPTGEQRTRIGRLLDVFGALVLEPWCERIVDVGVCATVEVGRVTAMPPHVLVTDARGNFVGIDVVLPPLEPGERAMLDAAVEAAGAAIAATGYNGPFAIDAFAYRAGGERRFRALCEINARYTFGWIARAFADRCGTKRLGFAPTPPAGATILIAPSDDRATGRIAAWIA